VKSGGSSNLWRPLRVSAFRNLLVADVIADVGAFMQNVGAAWLMVSLGAGPIYVALTQTAASLPYFLLALPAGSAGDIFDRRKLVLATETWMMGIALLLAVLTIGGFMSPWVLLVLTFALSAGDAFETPTWRAILPEVVPKDDLAAASALNGNEFNLSRGGWACTRGHSHNRRGRRRSVCCELCVVFRRHSIGCKVEDADSQADRAAGNVDGSDRCGHSLRQPLARDPDCFAPNRRGHVLLQCALCVAADGGSKRESECNRLWTLAWLLWRRCNHRCFGHAVGP
jgi:hypothetical protein